MNNQKVVHNKLVLSSLISNPPMAEFPFTQSPYSVPSPNPYPTNSTYPNPYAYSTHSSFGTLPSSIPSPNPHTNCSNPYDYGNPSHCYHFQQPPSPNLYPSYSTFHPYYSTITATPPSNPYPSHSPPSNTYGYPNTISASPSPNLYFNHGYSPPPNPQTYGYPNNTSKMISIFDGNEDAYWWLLCAEKSFNERGLSDAEKLTETASAMRGSGLTWWIWWSLRHSKLSWEPFTVAFLWQFQPEFRDVLPLSGDEVELWNSNLITPNKDSVEFLSSMFDGKEQPKAESQMLNEGIDFVEHQASPPQHFSTTVQAYPVQLKSPDLVAISSNGSDFFEQKVDDVKDLNVSFSATTAPSTETKVVRAVAQTPEQHPRFTVELPALSIHVFDPGGTLIIAVNSAARRRFRISHFRCVTVFFPFRFHHLHFCFILTTVPPPIFSPSFTLLWLPWDRGKKAQNARQLFLIGFGVCILVWAQ